MFDQSYVPPIIVRFVSTPLTLQVLVCAVTDAVGYWK